MSCSAPDAHLKYLFCLDNLTTQQLTLAGVQIGTTVDDAIGEAYDKVARMLNLELNPSGGPALEALALDGNPLAYPFTMPLATKPTCDFSYSGLKTAVRLAIEAEVGDDIGASAGQVQPLTQPVGASVGTFRWSTFLLLAALALTLLCLERALEICCAVCMMSMCP
jgi:hypothetical protein